MLWWEIGKIAIFSVVVIGILYGLYLIWIEDGFGSFLWSFIFWSFACFILFAIMFPSQFEDRSQPYSSATFNSGGVSHGNSTPKSVSDTPQVQDSSGAAGFGNGGESGHDAASVPPTSPLPAFSSMTTRPVQTYKSDLVAEYFSPNSGGNGVFALDDGESADALEGEDITIDFELPVDSGAVYYLNEVEVKGEPAASEVNDTWFRFTVVAGANVVKAVYNNETYTYTFNAFDER